MSIGYLIAKDSEPEEIEKAYQAAAFEYRVVVFDFFRSQKINSISKLAEESRCEYPLVAERFILEGEPIPTGKDIDRLIDRINGKGKWLKRIKNIQVHASLGNSKPANYEDRPQLGKDTDLAIREAFNKLDWFYWESSSRFARQNPT